MGLLKEATNTSAYLKAGFLGFPGSGKTRTAVDLAIGLAHIVDNKPVAFVDTENGSDYLIPRFKDAGVRLLVAKTRAFKDLLSVMREAEGQCSAVIVDSVTHIWVELMEAYQERYKVKRLSFDHWGPIKREWRTFTDLYLNSNVHAIICGRAGYEYEYEKDEQTGKKELIKTGTKMKVEGEMGYEPSLLVEMWRINKSEISGNPNDSGWSHRAVILKDRTDTMNGAEIDNPTFESWAPILTRLNLGGKHAVIDTTRTSVDMFDSPDTSAYEYHKQRDGLLEEIKGVFALAGIGTQGKDDRQKWAQALQDVFGTSSWTRIERINAGVLDAGLSKLRDRFGLPDPGVGEANELADPFDMEAEVERDIKAVQQEAQNGVNPKLHGRYFAMLKENRADLSSDEARRAWQETVTGKGSTKTWTPDDYRVAIAQLEADAVEIDA